MKSANCLNCNKAFVYSPYQKTGKYCTNRCQQDYQMMKKINEGTASSNTMKGYLVKKFGPQCSDCRWDKINIHTQKCPIEIDHIDGNSENNTPENCRLLCPNCHSLTGTYKALNKGNGRHARMKRYKEGKSF